MTDALSHGSRPPGPAPGATGARAPRGPSADTGTVEDRSAESAALRVALVGPADADDSAAAAHATLLAHHLADAGHEVTLVSWAHSSGDGGVTGGGPAGGSPVPPFARTIRALRRARPDSWLRAGRRLGAVDAVVVVHAQPRLAPAHVALLTAAGATAGGPGPRPQSVVVCLGDLPAASHPLDRGLVSALLSRVDSVLVHGPAEATAARSLGARRVSVAPLPPRTDDDLRLHRSARPGPTRLLTLGRVDGADGVAVLVRAMGEVPDVTLTIAGQLAGNERELVGRLAADPAVTGRVALHEGEMPAESLAALLAGHDVLALPFRAAAAARDILLGHAHGLPVLAPDVAPFSQQVTDGVNGLLVPAEDEAALAAALRRLGDPDVRRRLADGVRTPDLSGPWAHYLGAIEALSVDESVLFGEAGEPGADPSPDHPTPTDAPRASGQRPGGGPAAGRSWRHRLAHARRSLAEGARGASDSVIDRVAARPSARAAAELGGRLAEEVAGRGRHAVSRALASRRPLVTLRPDDLPDWVLATDVLGEPEQADDARRLSRILGLPRSLDSVSAWAALGTLAAILRVRDDGRRTAVIVDEGGTRSLLSRWARAVGFAPVEIDFTGTQPSVAALDVDAGSLDVIVRIHPQGCDGDDVDHVLEQASWALRSGGLLVVTVPIGPLAAEGAVGPADIRGVLARAHDLGFVLVGDLDGDVNSRMREAASRARADDAAYALVRLTLRRR